MHYLMMISQNSLMIHGLELLVKSIKFFSGNRDVYFSVVLQGEENSLPQNLNDIIFKIDNLKNKKILNYDISNYLIKNVEFYFCPYYWTLGVPCRWFIEPKLDSCVMIDVDMLACNNLDKIYCLKKNKIYGVKAKNNFWNEAIWQKINFSKCDVSNYYINFGLVVVPADYMQLIGKFLFLNYSKMMSLSKYYAGQLSLAYTFKKLNFNVNLLPKKFNFYDKDKFPGRENILFLHIMNNRKIYLDKAGLNNESNEYIDLIKMIQKEIRFSSSIL